MTYINNNNIGHKDPCLYSIHDATPFIQKESETSLPDSHSIMVKNSIAAIELVLNIKNGGVEFIKRRNDFAIDNVFDVIGSPF